jgi:glutathionylspermidine synthase
VVTTLRVGEPLHPDVFRQVWLDTVFDCFKLDPQFEDTPTLAPWPLVMRESEWAELAAAAEAMCAETLACETALLTRPDLLKELTLPRKCRSAIEQAGSTAPSPGIARVMRFDFHPTAEGWRVSEVNCDVPGGFIEATGFTANMARAFPQLRPCGDPTASLVEALAKAGGPVGLVHATAYLDDRQVMHFLQKMLARRGVDSHLLAPDGIEWREGRAFAGAELAAIFRFFPAEWLPNLPRRSLWRNFCRGAVTPQCNPATALAVQSKRLPLVWDRLGVPTPTWQKYLPETGEIRGRETDDQWVLKAAFGRVGDEVGIRGVTGVKELKQLERWARRRPRRWVAQRRFEALALPVDGGTIYPCIGIYTVDGKACGAYVRAARRALVDGRAQDVALLLESD